MIVLDNIALRAVPSSGLAANAPAQTMFGMFVGDSAGGKWYWSAGQTGADDNATIIKPNDIGSGDPGRWIRIIGKTVDMAWFNPPGNGIGDDGPAFQAAFALAQSLGKPLEIGRPRSADYYTSETFNINDNTAVKVWGYGAGTAGINAPATGSVELRATASGANSVGHNHSDICYAEIKDISFTAPNAVVNVLSQRSTSATASAQDVLYERCNFGGGLLAGVAINCLEVLHFRDCRFHAENGGFGVLITKRTEAQPYVVGGPIPSAFTFDDAEGNSATVVWFSHCEWVGADKPLIFIDANASTVNDVKIDGYMSPSGTACRGIMVYNGIVEMLDINIQRMEVASPSGIHTLLYLYGPALVKDLILRAYGEPAVKSVDGTGDCEIRGMRLDGPLSPDFTSIAYTAGTPDINSSDSTVKALSDSLVSARAVKSDSYAASLLATSGSGTTSVAEWYSRAGDRIFFEVSANVTAIGTLNGPLRITLPITMDASSPPVVCSVLTARVTLDPGYSYVIGQIGPGTDKVALMQGGSNKDIAPLSASNLNVGSGLVSIQVSGSYRTA